MAQLLLEKVYDVPHRREQGTDWYKCIYDLHLATKEVGWVVGTHQILYTNDGGKSWSNQFEEHSGPFINPRYVCATGASTCWLLSRGSSEEQLFHTRDGGDTWLSKKLEVGINLTHLFFYDRDTGWVLSDDGFIPARLGMIHITDDSGTNWKTFYLPTKGKPVRVHFIDEHRGWLVEHYIHHENSRIISHLYESTDGGHDWRPVKTFNGLITGVYPLGGDSLFIYGERGLVARTLDGGRSWYRKRLGNVTINSLAFFDKYLGVALCDNSILFISEDQGETWTQVDIPMSEDNFVKATPITTSEGIMISSKSIFLARLI
jgi:photosystem II stability/assembly factor-like uncharacterized protein